MTPALVAAKKKYPAAEIWVVVRRDAENILEGCPAIDRLITTVPPTKFNRKTSAWGDTFGLVRELRRLKFDYVFELGDGDRGRWLSSLCRARHRCTNAHLNPLSAFWRLFFKEISTLNWLPMHRVEKDFRTVDEFLPLGDEIPNLHFDKHSASDWPAAKNLSEFVVIHPSTRWRCKRYPEEKWEIIGKYLLSKFPHLILSCGPDEEEIGDARKLHSKLGDQVLFTEGKLNWGQIAGLLYRAKLFVGVDTAAMHLAAACQCPTVAIFGPSVPWMWRPWKTKAEVVSPDNHDAYARSLPTIKHIEKLRIESVSPSAVIASCNKLLSSEAAM